MSNKNPFEPEHPGFRYKSEEEDFRKAMVRRSEERMRFLDGLFHLPGRNLQEPEYIVDQLLPRGYLAILAGDPKVGKTCFATALAMAVATGTDFAGLKTNPTNVLWLSLEESPEERTAALGTFAQLNEQNPWPKDDFPSPGSSPSTDSQSNSTSERGGTLKEEGSTKPDIVDAPAENRKLKAENESAANRQPPTANHEVFGRPKEWQVCLPIFTCYQSLAIDSDEGIDALNHWISRAHAGLIIVDPLHAAHSGRSLSDGWAARRTLQPLKQLCARRRVTAVVLHHLGNRNGKPRVAENAQLSAVASMFMLLTKSPSLVSPEMREGLGEGDWPFSANNSPIPDLQTPNSKLQTRHFSLACQGRGQFANKTWHFESSSPSDYRIIESQDSDIDRFARNVEAAILTAFGIASPLTADQLVTALPTYAEGTVRNAVVRMRKVGLLIRLPGIRPHKYARSSQHPELTINGGKT